MPNSNAEADWQAAQFAHLSAFSFGTTAFSISLGAVLLPVLILGIAGEDLKNTYLGLLGLVGLLVAMVVQPIAGNLSDRTSSPWGPAPANTVVKWWLKAPPRSSLLKAAIPPTISMVPKRSLFLRNGAKAIKKRWN